MMQMDPDTGDIDFLVPADDFSEVVAESAFSWRILTADEAYSAKSQVLFESSSPVDFDTEFDALRSAHLQVRPS